MPMLARNPSRSGRAAGEQERATPRALEDGLRRTCDEHLALNREGVCKPA